MLVPPVASVADWRRLAPQAIERESLARVERALAERLPVEAAERALATRLVYASGDLSLCDLLRLSPGAVSRGVAALRGGATIVCDVQMVAAGVSATARERVGSPLLCAVSQAGVAEHARAEGITRSAAGMLLLEERLSGSVVAIGNAPTALLAVLELTETGRIRPALIVGMPVGFVAAAESKELLQRQNVASITVTGTRGGSALAAATLNLLLGWAAHQDAGVDGHA